MQGYGLVVRFVIRAGHEPDFDALVAETLVGIRTLEPGTLVYVSHTVPDQPGVRLFYELYRDRAAFEAHEQQPHVQHFARLRAEHLESFEVDVLTVVAGTSSSSGQ